MSQPSTRSLMPSIEFDSSRREAQTGACASMWKYIPQETNADSSYADDDPATLMEGTYKEQTARRIAIRALEAVLACQVSILKAERLHKELNSMRAVYLAQWEELEGAVGLEACEEVRQHVEGDGDAEPGISFRAAGQISLPL